MNEIMLAELDVEMLPERQTLRGNVTIGSPVVFAYNGSETVQALTLLSSAKSSATQVIVIL